MNKFYNYLVSVSALLIASTLFGSNVSAQMQALPNDKAVRKGKLENGLTYYIRHNSKPEKRAEFYLATNVGAIQETPDQDGLAHFLEHMCFNGTKNFPEKGIIEWLQSIGASFGGNINASTGVEETQYMLNNIPLVRETVVDTCLLILHDYSHFVINDPEEIDKERGVIIEERRQRRNASWRMHEKSLPYYFGDTKYGKCTLIGSQENLETFKPESLWDFYKTWYRPDLQAVVVVGDINVDTVEAKIKNIFSRIPATAMPKQKELIRIPGNKEPVIGIITDPEAIRTQVSVLWKSEAVPEEYNNTAAGMMQDIVKNIFHLVMAERFKDITSKPDAPYLSANMGIWGYCETMEAVTGNITVKEGKVLDSFEAFLKEIEKMKRYGFTESEIDRAKTNLLSSYEAAVKKAETRENSELVPELLNNFFDNYSYMEPNKEFTLVQALCSQINAQMFKEVTSECIPDSNMVVIITAPEKDKDLLPTESQILSAINNARTAEIKANKEENKASDLLDTKSLKGGKVKSSSPTLYGATEWTLSNGLKVILYPSDKEKDKITFTLNKKGGKSLIETEDLCSFDYNIFSLFMMNSGLSKFPNTDLSKMLAGKNLRVNVFLNELQHGISGSSTVKDLETAFQILYLSFVDPRFDKNEYETTIQRLRNVLPNFVQRPDYKFSVASNELLYGNNPRMISINEDVLNKADLATIERIYRQLFKDIAGARIIIAGDFTSEAIKPLVEKYLGSLPKGKKATNWIDRNVDILPGNRTKDFAVDMQTPKTTVYKVYTYQTPFSQEKKVALNAAKYILNMRFVKSLREDEGGTYGASVSTSLNRIPKQSALLNIYFDCKPSSADKLIKLANEGLNDLAKNGPTEEEFDMAFKNLKKNLPEQRLANSYWAGRLEEFYEYGEDGDKAYEEAINSLTPEKLTTALKELLNSGNCSELIMRPGTTGENE